MNFGPVMVTVPYQSEKILDEEFGPNLKTHMSFKMASLYGLRLLQENKNIPTQKIRDQIEHFTRLLPKKGTLVRLENVII